MELIADIQQTTTQSSPFSVRFYTHNIPAPNTSDTIPICIQIDGGANRSITNQKHLLQRYTTVSKYPIYGVNQEDVALTCVGRGYLPWIAANGETLYVPTLFSPDAADTIISPTDVVMSYAHLYTVPLHSTK
jgi:hypothetical protein